MCASITKLGLWMSRKRARLILFVCNVYIECGEGGLCASSIMLRHLLVACERVGYHGRRLGCW